MVPVVPGASERILGEIAVMDKEVVDKIKQAIHLIHHEDKHYEGLNILAKLVGWEVFDFPTKSMPLAEFIKEMVDKKGAKP